jgi:hypothetical protein
MKIGGKSSQEPKGDEEIGGNPVIIGGIGSSALCHMVKGLVDGKEVKHGLTPAQEICARGGDGEVYVVLDVNAVDGGRVGWGMGCQWLVNGGGDREDGKGIGETAEIERIGENWGGWCSGNIWPLLEGSLRIGIEGVDGWVLRICGRSRGRRGGGHEEHLRSALIPRRFAELCDVLLLSTIDIYTGDYRGSGHATVHDLLKTRTSRRFGGLQEYK